MIAYKRFRRFLFWTFVTAFWVTAATVLFFALGYRYSFDRGIFVYSGSITLKTIPENVTIRVDHELLPEQRLGILNNSIHIAGLMPGEHRIDITAPGYLPWTRHAIVTSGRSTEFWNILLTREQYVVTELPATEGTLRVFPSPENNIFALLKQQNDVTSLVILNQNTGVATERFSTKDAYFDQTRDTLHWSPRGNWVGLTLEGDHPEAILTSATKTIPLTSLHPNQAIQTLEFVPNEEATVLYLVNHTLYSLDLTQETLVPNMRYDGIRTYTLSGNTLFFLYDTTESLASFRASDTAPTPEPLIDTDPETLGSSPYTLVVYDQNRLALIEREGKQRLFIYNHSSKENYGFREIGSNVSDIQFSDDGKKLLFYSRNEVNVYFFRPWEVQPERAENSVLQIARFSDPIKSPVWSEDYEHILFLHGKTVKIVELDHRDLRALSDLISLPGEPLSITTSFAENLLYLTFADQSVLSFVFPEPQGLFGQ